LLPRFSGDFLHIELRALEARAQLAPLLRIEGTKDQKRGGRGAHDLLDPAYRAPAAVDESNPLPPTPRAVGANDDLATGPRAEDFPDEFHAAPTVARAYHLCASPSAEST
jgi:hypothetical protein